MATHLKIVTLEGTAVHFDSGCNDYTLCGLDTMGDPRLGIEEPKVVKAKVDCQACIRIYEFCRKIKPSETI